MGLTLVVALTFAGCSDVSHRHQSTDPPDPAFDHSAEPMPKGVNVVSSRDTTSNRFSKQGDGFRSEKGAWTLVGGSRAYKKWLLCGDDPETPSGEMSIAVPRGDETYFVRLTARWTGRRLAEVIVSPGKTTVISVPICQVGRTGYELYYGAGTRWYGYKYLFGPEGAYSQAGEVFTFESGTSWSVSLTLQQGGNLSSSGMEYDQFLH